MTVSHFAFKHVRFTDFVLSPYGICTVNKQRSNNTPLDQSRDLHNRKKVPIRNFIVYLDAIKNACV